MCPLIVKKGQIGSLDHPFLFAKHQYLGTLLIQRGEALLQGAPGQQPLCAVGAEVGPWGILFP